MQNDAKAIYPRSGEGSVPNQLSRPPHFLSSDEVALQLQTDPENGLSAEEAKSRLAIFGPNELSKGAGVSAGRILAKQIFNAMSLVLVMAMVSSFAIKSWIEAGVITAVVVVNIVVGFFQEFSAEKTMDSLRSLSSPTATVIRSGQVTVIPSVGLVPGDVIEVKTGDTIPADMRLREAVNMYPLPSITLEANIPPSHFEVDEALLTGESLPVVKDANICFKESEEVSVGDCINISFSSSIVTRGRAWGIVSSTGMKTEIGKIAQSLRGDSRFRRVHQDDGHAKLHHYLKAGSLIVKDQVGKFLGVSVGTPLQKKLSWLAIYLFIIAVIFAIICLAANKFQPRRDVILYAVGTGLSMIPASLVVVLTITMAVGTKTMVKRNVIVRKLDSLEALGAVTNVCSDKTGTLTQGKMVVKKAWVIAEGTYSVGESRNPLDPMDAQISFSTELPHDTSETATISRANPQWNVPTAFLGKKALEKYLNVATFANLAVVSQNKVTGVWDGRGDPTELAIQVFASRFDWNRRRFTHGDPITWEQKAEFPFDSEVKRMAVIYRNFTSAAENGYQHWAFMKGAVERVFDACTTAEVAEGQVRLSGEIKEQVIKNMEALASQGLRVLAFAYKTCPALEDWTQFPRSEVEKDMCLLGLIGLYDPPRIETAAAVRACHRAGINVHMLTGDHPQTAKAIAIEVGIIPKTVDSLTEDVISAMVMRATEFDRLTDEEVDHLPVLPLVIARCAPQTKVRMVEALHRRKKFVAMTGDGINDSPALKRADVGIGMGLAGSDVAKNASDIVLTDDNFASILNSIEEGRRMFDNIKKFVLHLLAENIAQACTLLIGLAFKDDTGISVFPLAPVEILWIIMITSGFPAMGLGMEVASDDIMTRPPHNRRVGIFTPEVLIDMIIYGSWMAVLCLSSFFLVVWGFNNGQLGHDCNNVYSSSCEVVFRARSTTFVSLTWFALFLAWEMVHTRRSFFRMEPKPKHPYTLWIRHVWRNPFLFWSIFSGFVTVFPIIYIPVINRKVFKHAPITWEWGIVFIEAALFFAGVEGWKFLKRIYYRRWGEKVVNPELELSGRAFAATAVSSDVENQVDLTENE